MRHKLLISAIALFALTSFAGCKSNENGAPKPAETLEVKTLKSYYANVAKVPVANVVYDQATDVFSIQNSYKISHDALLKHYNISLTGKIQ
jgi:hypothetical protein